MAHGVFISHSSKDKNVADAMCAWLEGAGVPCWIAPRDISPGENWGASILKALQSSRVMVLVFSNSANASPQIKREVERAVNAGVAILPFRIDSVLPAEDLAYFLGTPHWLDAFDPPLEQHFDALLLAVQQLLAMPPQPNSTPLPESGTGLAQAPRRAVKPRRGWLRPLLAGMAVLLLLAAGMVLGIVGYSHFASRAAPAESTSAAPDSSPVPDQATAAPPAPADTTQPSAPAGTAPPAPASTASTPAAGAGDAATQRVNLFTPTYAEAIAVPNSDWEKLLNLTQSKDDSVFVQPEDSENAVYGFKNGQALTINTIRLYIPESQGYNIKTLELLVGDSPAGPFQSAAKVAPVNLRMSQSGGWQEFRIASVTPRYFKLKLASVDDGSYIRFDNNGEDGVIQLLGTIGRPAP